MSRIEQIGGSNGGGGSPPNRSVNRSVLEMIAFVQAAYSTLASANAQGASFQKAACDATAALLQKSEKEYEAKLEEIKKAEDAAKSRNFWSQIISIAVVIVVSVISAGLLTGAALVVAMVVAAIQLTLSTLSASGHPLGELLKSMGCSPKLVLIIESAIAVVMAAAAGIATGGVAGGFMFTGTLAQMALIENVSEAIANVAYPPAPEGQPDVHAKDRAKLTFILNMVFMALAIICAIGTMKCAPNAAAEEAGEGFGAAMTKFMSKSKPYLMGTAAGLGLAGSGFQIGAGKVLLDQSNLTRKKGEKEGEYRTLLSFMSRLVDQMRQEQEQHTTELQSHQTTPDVKGLVAAETAVAMLLGHAV